MLGLCLYLVQLMERSSNAGMGSRIVCLSVLSYDLFKLLTNKPNENDGFPEFCGTNAGWSGLIGCRTPRARSNTLLRGATFVGARKQVDFAQGSEKFITR